MYAVHALDTDEGHREVVALAASVAAAEAAILRREDRPDLAPHWHATTRLLLNPQEWPEGTVMIEVPGMEVLYFLEPLPVWE